MRKTLHPWQSYLASFLVGAGKGGFMMGLIPLILTPFMDEAKERSQSLYVSLGIFSVAAAIYCISILIRYFDKKNGLL